MLNGRKAAGNEILKDGDTVTIWFSDETLAKFASSGHDFSGRNFSGSDFSERNFSGSDFPGKESMRAEKHIYPGRKGGNVPYPDIIYEDDNVMFINKPAGILSQDDGTGKISMVSMIRNYLMEKEGFTEDDFRLYRPSVVNRLDMNTSGLIMAAKTLPAARELSGMIGAGQLRKYYIALAAGRAGRSKDERAWLKRENGRTVSVSSSEKEGYSEIHTSVEPLAFCPLTDFICQGIPDADRGVTLVRVGLHTGRTHQIRAYMASIGHPVIGDVKYGNAGWNTYSEHKWGLKRQFLHSRSVVFPDSAGGALRNLSGKKFEAGIPEDLKKVFESMGIQADSVL